jgi:hypothetical protein
MGMRLQRLGIVVCLLFMAWLIARAGRTQDGSANKKPPPTRSTQALMQDKLSHAHKVLEGIAIEDFDKISENARLMGLIGQSAAWHVIDTPQYDRHLKNFQETVSDLDRQAKLKNLDGAAFAYVRMTMTCVECHKHIRAVRPADADGKAAQPSERARSR